MIRDIAVLTNSQGSTDSVYNAKLMKIFRKSQQGWSAINEYSISLCHNVGLLELRLQTRQLIDLMGGMPCHCCQQLHRHSVL